MATQAGAHPLPLMPAALVEPPPVPHVLPLTGCLPFVSGPKTPSEASRNTHQQVASSGGSRATSAHHQVVPSLAPRHPHQRRSQITPVTQGYPNLVKNQEGGKSNVADKEKDERKRKKIEKRNEAGKKKELENQEGGKSKVADKEKDERKRKKLEKRNEAGKKKELESKNKEDRRKEKLPEKKIEGGKNSNGNLVVNKKNI